MKKPCFNIIYEEDETEKSIIPEIDNHDLLTFGLVAMKIYEREFFQKLNKPLKNLAV